MTLEAAESRDDRGFLPGPRIELGATGSGPLSGLTVAVKDMFDIAGHVTGCGSPDWAATGQRAAMTARSVQALLGAGARCIGKTISDELAFSLEGRNAHYGTSVNPRDPTVLAGGSSSGSAVAVAAGAADIGLGSDTGGSVRIPGAFCGIWAMRPTHGRVSAEGLQPFAPSYDTVGWFARTPDILAAIGGVLLGKDSAYPQITQFLVATDACALAESRVKEEVLEVAASWSAAPVEAFRASWQESSATYSALQARDIRTALAADLSRRRPRFGTDIAPRFQAAMTADTQVAQHEALRLASRAHLDQILPPGSALIIPTSPVGSLARDVAGAALGDFYLRALALCAIAGHAGAPQVHVPCGRTGFSLVGRPGSDLALLDVARSWRPL